MIEGDENINSSQSDIELDDMNKQFSKPKVLVCSNVNQYLNSQAEIDAAD